MVGCRSEVFPFIYTNIVGVMCCCFFVFFLHGRAQSKMIVNILVDFFFFR